MEYLFVGGSLDGERRAVERDEVRVPMIGEKWKPGEYPETSQFEYELYRSFRIRGVEGNFVVYALNEMTPDEVFFSMIQKYRPMPQIKPLVWVQTGERQRIAITSIGAFEVWECMSEEAWKAIFNGQQEYKFGSEALAKAACQQEYERRVRECLQ